MIAHRSKWWGDLSRAKQWKEYLYRKQKQTTPGWGVGVDCTGWRRSNATRPLVPKVWHDPDYGTALLSLDGGASRCGWEVCNHLFGHCLTSCRVLIHPTFVSMSVWQTVQLMCAKATVLLFGLVGWHSAQVLTHDCCRVYWTRCSRP